MEHRWRPCYRQTVCAIGRRLNHEFGSLLTASRTGYIAVMAKQAGEDPPKADMSKTEASEKIEELKKKTGM